jgi:hypothetical protein
MFFMMMMMMMMYGVVDKPEPRYVTTSNVNSMRLWAG